MLLSSIFLDIQCPFGFILRLSFLSQYRLQLPSAALAVITKTTPTVYEVPSQILHSQYHWHCHSAKWAWLSTFHIWKNWCPGIKLFITMQWRDTARISTQLSDFSAHAFVLSLSWNIFYFTNLLKFKGYSRPSLPLPKTRLTDNYLIPYCREVRVNISSSNNQFQLSWKLRIIEFSRLRNIFKA